MKKKGISSLNEKSMPWFKAVNAAALTKVMVVGYGHLFVTTFVARTVGAQCFGFRRAASGSEEMRRLLYVDDKIHNLE